MRVILCVTKINYNKLLQLKIIEGKTDCKRGTGREKMPRLHNVRRWPRLRTIERLIHTERESGEMENVVANIH